MISLIGSWFLCLLHFVAFFHVASLFSTGVVNKKVGVENEIALQLTHSTHTTYSRNNMCQKCEGNCGLRVLDEIIKKVYPENLKKKSWVPFGSYLLNSTANPAHLHPNSQDFLFCFNVFIYFSNTKTLKPCPRIFVTYKFSCR